MITDQQGRVIEIVNGVEIEPKQYNNVIAKQIVDILKERKYLIATSESCTAGRIVASLTSMSGSSEVVRGGICAYCDEIKHQLLDVPMEDLKKYTAVSEPVAIAMARGIKKVMGTNCSISATGYADGKKVIYVCASLNDKFVCKELNYNSSRLYNTNDAVKEGLQLMLSLLQEEK